jgi:hypothetical protein
MSINILMGVVSAAIMNARGVPRQQLLAGAAFSSVTPGLLGVMIPLALANQAGKQSAANAPASAPAAASGAAAGAPKPAGGTTPPAPGGAGTSPA